jgi:hypothetical protein
MIGRTVEWHAARKLGKLRWSEPVVDKRCGVKEELANFRIGKSLLKRGSQGEDQDRDGVGNPDTGGAVEIETRQVILTELSNIPPMRKPLRAKKTSTQALPRLCGKMLARSA